MRHAFISVLPKLAQPECATDASGARRCLAELSGVLPPGAKRYNVLIGRYKVGVWLAKRCYYIYNAPKASASCRNSINRSGHLTIGWGDSLSNAWSTVLETLGLDEEGKPHGNQERSRPRGQPKSEPKKQTEREATASRTEEGGGKRQVAEVRRPMQHPGEEEGYGPVLEQPEPLAILADINPGSGRYSVVCHYVFIVWSDRFWLRFLLASWQDGVMEAYAERMFLASETRPGDLPDWRHPFNID